MQLQSEIFLRVLLHVDSEGTARLLDTAILVTTAGGSSLHARRPRLPEDATVTRMTAPGFAFPDGVLELDGRVAPGEVLTASWQLAPDDAQNPYRHEGSLRHGTATGPPHLVRSANIEINDRSTDAMLVGTYEETIAGLMAEPALVRGWLMLERVADITEFTR